MAKKSTRLHCIYSVFFIEPTVFVHLTHLSDINEHCLIFSVVPEHSIISVIVNAVVKNKPPSAFRYKAVIVFEGLAYIATWCLLLWGRGLLAMQVI